MSHNCVIVNVVGQNVNLECLQGCRFDSFLQNYDISSKDFGHALKFKILFNGQEIEFKIGDNVYHKPGSHLTIDETLDFKGYGRLKVKSLEIPKRKFKKSMLENEAAAVHRHETEVENLTDEYSILPPKIQTIMPPNTESVLPSIIKNKIVIPRGKS